MEDRSWLYLVGAASLLGVMILAAQGQRVSLTPSDSILLIGDSLAAGLSAPLGSLSSDAGIPFASDGRVSTRLDQWLDQGWAEADIQSMIAQQGQKPTVLLVSLGTNDAVAPGLLPAFAARAKALVDLAKTYDMIVLWIAPPEMPFDTSVVEDGIGQSGAVVFRSAPISIPRGPDQIHPTASGYAAWSSLIWQSMSPPRPTMGPSQSLGRLTDPRSTPGSRRPMPGPAKLQGGARQRAGAEALKRTPYHQISPPPGGPRPQALPPSIVRASRPFSSK